MELAPTATTRYVGWPESLLVRGRRRLISEQERGEDCQYPTVHRKTPKKVRKANHVLEQRLACLEGLIEANEVDLFPPPANSYRHEGASVLSCPRSPQRNDRTPQTPTSLQEIPLDNVSAHQISAVSMPTAQDTMEPVISSQLHDETSSISVGPGPATGMSEEAVVDTEMAS